MNLRSRSVGPWLGGDVFLSAFSRPFVFPPISDNCRVTVDVSLSLDTTSRRRLSFSWFPGLLDPGPSMYDSSLAELISDSMLSVNAISCLVALVCLELFIMSE